MFRIVVDRLGNGDPRRAAALLDSLSSCGIEVGLAVCRVDGKLVPSRRTPMWREGTFLPQCEEGELVGAVHSHRVHKRSCTFSIADWVTSLEEGLEFTCLLCNEGSGWKLKCIGLPAPGTREWEAALEDAATIARLLEEEDVPEDELAEMLGTLEESYAKWVEEVKLVN